MKMNKGALFLSLLERLQLWGQFDKGLFHYALRTALASCVALACGWLLGLDHPQWAAMSVWAASQPRQTKGMLLEKALFRFLGTIVGTLVGGVILWISNGDLLMISLGLTIWLTLCTGVGNLIHGLFSYLVLLSGYTASLVLLLDVTQGSDIYALGADRMLTVLLGVMIATGVGLIWNKQSDEEVISVRLKRLTHETLLIFSQVLTKSLSPRQMANLIREAAAIDSILDSHGAGSIRSRRSVHTIRAVIHSNLSLLTYMNTGISKTSLRSLEANLQRLSITLKQDLGLKAELECLEEINAQVGDSDLEVVLRDLHSALTQRLYFKESGSIVRLNTRHLVVLHRDWVAAKQAMVRTFVVLGSIGVIWTVTGSPTCAFIMLGSSVMLLLFSTFEAPATLMKRMVLWQFIGLGASILTRGYFWGNVSNEFSYLLIMVACILFVVLPLSSARFNQGAMDYVMMYLLLSQPKFPVYFDMGVDLPMGLAAVGGTIVALLAFSVIFQTNRVKRSIHIKTSMINDLYRIYNVGLDKQKITLIHSRAQHRLLKWVDNGSSVRSNEHVLATLSLLSIIQLVGQIKFRLISHRTESCKTRALTQTLDDAYRQLEQAEMIVSQSNEIKHLEPLKAMLAFLKTGIIGR